MEKNTKDLEIFKKIPKFINIKQYKIIFCFIFTVFSDIMSCTTNRISNF